MKPATARHAWRIVLLVLLAVLAGCSARPRAVVVERSVDTRPPVSVASAAAPAEYVVRRGDTLFGIAFRHGLDFREIARNNDIAAPYTIYPGQRLRLGGAGRVPSARAPVASTSPPATAPGSATGTATRPVTPLRPPPPPPPTGGVTAPDAPASAAPPVAATAPAQKPAASAPTTAAGGPVIWRWPTDGQLLASFSAGDPTRQGIDIVGRGGQPVFAAADGEVVYSGAGLVGYGELIIIKHSDTWLSAYGHNRKRMVAEGQRVKGGQQIAEMGRSGASRDMLHFEIRRNGRPVDPLPLLPRR